MAATDNKAPPIVTHTEAIELLKTKIKPTINNKWDALFIFIHAVLEANGFKLVGLGEEDNLVEDKKLPTDWNKSTDAWAFRYRHGQSSMLFLVKGLRLGAKLLLHAIAVEQNQIYNLELDTTDYITTDNFSDISNVFKNAEKLTNEINTKIALNLVPTVDHLRQTAREQQQTTTPAQPTPSSQPPPSSQPFPNPTPYPPGQRPPDYDPLRIGPPRYPRPYPGVGHDDLDPFGGMGMFPSPYGPSPYGPYGPGGPFPGRGGNLVGPGHPMFGPVNNPYAPQLPGGRGFYPPPPGARFDPFNPPGMRPEPDNDHERPPRGSGYDDMFS